MFRGAENVKSAFLWKIRNLEGNRNYFREFRKALRESGMPTENQKSIKEMAKASRETEKPEGNQKSFREFP